MYKSVSVESPLNVALSRLVTRLFSRWLQRKHDETLWQQHRTHISWTTGIDWNAVLGSVSKLLPSRRLQKGVFLTTVTLARVHIFHRLT